MIKENKPLATFHMPDRDLYIFTESMGLDSEYLLYDADMQCLTQIGHLLHGLAGTRCG